MNPFSPLAGLFLAYVRGGERATIVISKRPQCARAVNATLAIMVGHVTINVSTYGRSADGFRVTVRLPSYDAVMDGVGGGKETKNITVKAIATYTRGEGTVETPLLSWSCPPSCPGESGRNEPSEGDTRKRIGWKNTNQSFLHPGNTAALRKAVGGVTYVRRCTSNKGNTSAASSQSSSSSPPPKNQRPGTPQPAESLRQKQPYQRQPHPRSRGARRRSKGCCRSLLIRAFASTPPKHGLRHVLWGMETTVVAAL
jgi:hypothetical protein